MFRKLGPQKAPAVYDYHVSAKREKFLQQKNRSQFMKFIKLAGLILLVLVAGKILLSVPGFINHFRKPFQNLPGNLVNVKKIDFNYRVNFLIGSLEENNLRELAIASISKQDKKLSILVLDPQTFIYTSSGSVTLKELLTFENEKINLDPLAAKLTDNLGYAFDGYLFTTEGAEWVSEDSVGKIIDYAYSTNFFFKIFSVKSYLDKNLRTNLTLGNLMTVASLSKSSGKDNVNFFDFADDKTENGFFDTEKIGNKLALTLKDTKISQEASTVNIVNASSVEGVEIVLKQVLTNMGASVVSVSKTDPTDKTSLFSNNHKNSLEARLEEVLNTKAQKLENSNGVDIKVVIGEDWAEYFNF